MQVPDQCDVLVVGAGPAGSMAAATAARAGAQVLLIDAKPRIGEHPHCGEFVPAQVFSEFSLNRKSIIQPVNSMESRILADPHAPDHGDRRASAPPVVVDSSIISSGGFMIDRARFDRDLAREAAAAGALVQCDMTLVGHDEDSWVTESRGRRFMVRPGIVIAADGVHSRVARLIGFTQPETLIGVQVEVPLIRPSDATLVLLHGAISGGYAWMFPKGNVANVGLGMDPTAGAHPGRVLERVLRWLTSWGFIKAGCLARTGGMIPVSGLRDRLVHGNVLLCGDAAGLTHPITGAGIAPALMSGTIAGRLAAEAVRAGKREILAEYESEIRGYYEGVLRHAASKRELLRRSAGGMTEAVHRATWIGFRGYRKRENLRKV